MDNLKKRPKLLIVDDDPFARKLVKGILANHNFRILESENGFDAVRQTWERQPDLIIMDVIMPMGGSRVQTEKASHKHAFSDMPDMMVMDVSIPSGNGIDAARVIKRKYPNIPILGVSGAESAQATTLGAQDYLQLLKMVGVDATLQKPLTREILIDVVDSLLAKKAAADKDLEAFEKTLISKLAASKKANAESAEAVPPNLSSYLSKEQVATIKKMENFGWKLQFVRRSTPGNVVALMRSPTGENTAVVEVDGDLNVDHHVYLRHSSREE